MREESKTTNQIGENQDIRSAVTHALSRIEHPEVKEQNIVDLIGVYKSTISRELRKP